MPRITHRLASAVLAALTLAALAGIGWDGTDTAGLSPVAALSPAVGIGWD